MTGVQEGITKIDPERPFRKRHCKYPIWKFETERQSLVEECQNVFRRSVPFSPEKVYRT